MYGLSQIYKGSTFTLPDLFSQKVCKGEGSCRNPDQFVFHLQIASESSDRERDVYEELLTQAEIQGNINKVNSKCHVILRILIKSVLQNDTCASLFL